MKQRNKLLVAVRRAIRSPYSWPGGYPVYILLADGQYLCAECARENYRALSKGTRNELRDGWRVDYVSIYWEGPTEDCAHCNKPVIESAYGDPDEPEQDTE